MYIKQEAIQGRLPVRHGEWCFLLVVQRPMGSGESATVPLMSLHLKGQVQVP